jgi:hypothetical protein
VNFIEDVLTSLLSTNGFCVCNIVASVHLAEIYEIKEVCHCFQWRFRLQGPVCPSVSRRIRLRISGLSVIYSFPELLISIFSGCILKI